MKIDDIPDDEYIALCAEDGTVIEGRILGSTVYRGDKFIVSESLDEKKVFVADARVLEGLYVAVSNGVVANVLRKFTDENPETIGDRHLLNCNSVITVTDDQGNEIGFELLDLLEKDGKTYMVALPAEDEYAEEVYILEVRECGDLEEYLVIDDESLLYELFELFKERNKDSFNFE